MELTLQKKYELKSRCDRARRQLMGAFDDVVSIADELRRNRISSLGLRIQTEKHALTQILKELETQIGKIDE